ncbi:thiol-disulfide oxidoreductase DCC family protein [Microbulbifer hainanensis]|uniref:thiol-disulfide oxidoreductase DCC family protein n=1 Tax=Microbulbifer hainanensis TaxID=2735675 RepID=UPI001869237B|nr:DCC1-like thiol-disulfide oxidoreductase family protein [Microbulbifer hainanensis]
MPASRPDRLILFDSLCNLCNGWSRFVLRNDRNCLFTLCRVQSPAGQQLLEELGLPLDTYETVIYLERVNGAYRQFHRSEAALRITAQLPGPWRHLALLRAIPLSLRDWIYDRVARNRYRLFGRRSECRLPDAAERHRFLEELNR